MDMREKLVELLDSHCDYAGHVDCKDDCTKCLANYLIANGVTLAKDINVPATDINVGSKEEVDLMCEILFHGKRLDNGEWIEGFYCKHNTAKTWLASDDPKPKHLIIVDGFCDWGFEPPLQGIEVDPATVGRYTGQTDKNGKRIFEGDIVRYKDKIYVISYIPKYVRFAGIAPGVVMAVFLFSACEIVGNVHDDPGLLEGTKNNNPR